MQMRRRSQPDEPTGPSLHHKTMGEVGPQLSGTFEIQNPKMISVFNQGKPNVVGNAKSQLYKSQF